METKKTPLAKENKKFEIGLKSSRDAPGERWKSPGKRPKQIPVPVKIVVKYENQPREFLLPTNIGLNSSTKNALRQKSKSWQKIQKKLPLKIKN